MSVPAETNGSSQPSHNAIDNLNSDTHAQRPTYFALDDINVDLITMFTVLSGTLSVFLLGTSVVKAASLIALVLLPLRMMFPMATKPTGLALVTGASSGIGAELAYIFAKNGSDLVLVGRNEEQLGSVKSNIETTYQRTAHVIVADLSVPGASKRLYDEVIARGLVVDILVNDAGFGHAGDVMEQPEELAERMIALNCTALVQLTQYFGKDMIKRRRGWILELSSVVGWMVGPGQNIYHASKHFVRAFSEAMSMELRGTPIVLTQLMPGPVHTQFATRANLEKTFTFSSSGAVENARNVAQAGYNGLCKHKRMVFSSWNAAFMATSMHLMPRSLHLTIARLMNTPTPNVEMSQPKKQQ